jgi:hypothetical protein
MGARVSSHVESERARVASRVKPECAAGVSDPTCRRWRARESVLHSGTQRRNNEARRCDVRVKRRNGPTTEQGNDT